MSVISYIERFASAYINDNICAPRTFRNANVLAAAIQFGANQTGFNLYGYNIINPNATPVFVKIYDNAGGPTVGVTTPIATYQVPAQGSVVMYGSDVLSYIINNGWVAVTTGYLDSNNTAAALGCIVELKFK